MTIKLVVADDHDVVRAGLKAALANTDIKVVGEATTGADAIRAVAKHKPQVVLLDVQMPVTDGLSVLGKLRSKWPDLAILMFSGFDNRTYVVRAAALGANGFLRKDVKRSELIDAIHRVADGASIWKRDELRRASAALTAPRATSQYDAHLTPRELDVLRLAAEGDTNREIARALEISTETVKEHVQNALRKMGVGDRTQGALWAFRAGVL